MGHYPTYPTFLVDVHEIFTEERILPCNSFLRALFLPHIGCWIFKTHLACAPSGFGCFQSKCRCLCWELSYELAAVQSSAHSSESHGACVSLCCVKLFLQLIKWCAYLVCICVHNVGHIGELFYIFTFCLGCTKGNSDSFRIIQNNWLILILTGTVWRQDIWAPIVISQQPAYTGWGLLRSVLC